MKLDILAAELRAQYVAPFAGAWIEIIFNIRSDAVRKVAPFAGAWIEIANISACDASHPSRSLRGSVD